MTLRNLHIIEDFLDASEIEFWSHILPQGPWHRHPQQKSGESLDGRFASQDPVYSAYQELVNRACSTLEDIYEEPLTITRGPSFRRYLPGDEIALHYDYACDGDGDVLQLHEENRRPGEMSPYPAGLHDIQSVIYYNDDYSGGLVKFGEEEWIRPSAGMLITWPSTKRYGHMVSEITGGERYISAGFWVRAKTLAIATKTNLLAPNWPEIFLWPEKVHTMLGRNLDEGQRIRFGITRVD